MTREQIEKAVNEYIGHAEEVGEGIDTCMRHFVLWMWTMKI